MSLAQALVLAGHGSQRHPRSAAPLHAHADRIRGSGRFDAVRTAFWKEQPSLRDVAATLPVDVAYVVPVLTSEGYFADEVFPRELRVGGTEPTASGAPDVRYAEPVGTHDAMTDVIAGRVEAEIEGPASEVGLALVGHGTERHEGSARATLEHARRIRELDRYAEVRALFLDEDPHVGELYDCLDATELVVVPVFVADGHHTTRDVPRAIGHPGIGESGEIDGRVVHYTGAVGTDPRLAEVIVERAVEAGATVGSGGAGASRTQSGEAFLRRVNRAADGFEWGELWVARGPDGYELRHRQDVGASGEGLVPIDGPRELRTRLRTDDLGRYRPLPGARSLPTGWLLLGLGSDGLLRAVRTVYPGSVDAWYREERGELEPTGFRETALRQTGLLAGLGGVDEAGLAGTVEAVCGDCVRRRCWEAAPGEAIDAASGDGAIPCREACPFLLSAAHAFADAEAVDPTRREDPAVPLGAFEEPGNRYRVRFARTLDGGEPPDVGDRPGEEPVTASRAGDR